MSKSTLIRTTALTALILAAGLAPRAPAIAADTRGDVPMVHVAASDTASRFVTLGVGKSVAIDLPSDIKDVLVADPKIANAVVRSARRVYMIGVKVGQTNIFFFDANGHQIAGYNIAVTRDLNGLRQAIKHVIPDSNIQVRGMNDGVILSGTAPSPAQAQQAYDIASRLVGENVRVVNAITVQGRDEVMIKVTVAEVQRDVIKQLGIDLSGSLSYGTAVVNFNTDNPFSATGQALSSTSIAGTAKNVTTTLQAMDRAGVIRTLAQPTLTAISGESATFMAGGEFPIPKGLTCQTTTTCQPEIEFKKFGVSLRFTPVVLTEGRISLKVMTEVSDVSQENSITLNQNGFNTTIPSIQTRRAETTVEIPSGGSLALAGMIRDQSKQAINGLPGLMQVPVLGTLFRSRDYISHKSELMILVTPYIVRAVAENKLARPDDGFEDASDPSTILMGSLNRIYGTKPKDLPTAHAYHGKYGFILD